MIPSLVLALAANTGTARTQDQAPEEPFACRLNALDKAQRQRQHALLESVRRAAQAMQDLPEGLALTLPSNADVFRDAAEWVTLEHRCCRSSTSRSNGNATTASG